jgi:hypothetical protein
VAAAGGADTTTPRSLHLIADGCVTEIVWGAFTETASQAWNAVWSVFGINPVGRGGRGLPGTRALPNGTPTRALLRGPTRCFNMALRLRNPTLDTRRYMRYYHVYAWGLAAVLAVAEGSLHAYVEVYDAGFFFCGQAEASLRNPAILLQTLLTYSQVAVALVSAAYLLCRLRRVQTPAGRRAGRHHAAYVLVFILVWLLQRTFRVIPGVPAELRHVVTFVWLAQAFLIAGLRLAEPGVARALFRALRARCCACRPSCAHGSVVAPALRERLLLPSSSVPEIGPDDDGDLFAAPGAASPMTERIAEAGSRSPTMPRRVPGAAHDARDAASPWGLSESLLAGRHGVALLGPADLLITCLSVGACKLAEVEFTADLGVPRTLSRSTRTLLPTAARGDDIF